MTGSSPRQSSQGLSAVRERVADSVWIRHEYPLRGTCGQRVVNLLCVQVNHPLTTLINPLPTRRRETLCNSEVACGATTIKPVCIKEKRRQSRVIEKPIQQQDCVSCRTLYVKVITLSDIIFSMRYGARVITLIQNG